MSASINVKETTIPASASSSSRDPDAAEPHPALAQQAGTAQPSADREEPFVNDAASTETSDHVAHSCASPAFTASTCRVSFDAPVSKHEVGEQEGRSLRTNSSSSSETLESPRDVSTLYQKCSTCKFSLPLSAFSYKKTGAGLEKTKVKKTCQMCLKRKQQIYSQKKKLTVHSAAKEIPVAKSMADVQKLHGLVKYAPMASQVAGYPGSAPLRTSPSGMPVSVPVSPYSTVPVVQTPLYRPVSVPAQMKTTFPSSTEAYYYPPVAVDRIPSPVAAPLSSGAQGAAGYYRPIPYYPVPVGFPQQSTVYPPVQNKLYYVPY